MINITSARGKQKARVEILRAMTLLEASAARDIRPILSRQFLSAARSVAVGSYNVNAAVNSQRGRMIVAFKRNYRRTATVFNQMAMGKLGAVGAVAGQVLPVSDVEEIIPEVKGSREEFWSALNMSINKDTAKRVVNVGKTTKKRIQNVIRRGMESKLSNREIAKNLRGISAIANPKRAKVIARTETHSASMQAIDESVKTAGVKTTKDWIGANDTRSRDIPGKGRIHVEATRTQKKIPDDKPFIVGGEELMYPGDFKGSGWNVIECRCAVIYDVVKAAAKPEKGKPAFVSSTRDAETACVSYTKETGNEMAFVIDQTSGKKIGPMLGSKYECDIDYATRLLRKDRRYSIIHSHPGKEQIGLSHLDIQTVMDRALYTEIRAVTKDWEYVVKKINSKDFPSAYRFKKEWLGEWSKSNTKLFNMRESGEITTAVADRMGADIANKAMAEKYSKNYTYEMLSRKKGKVISKLKKPLVVAPRLPVGDMAENAWVDSLDRKTAQAFNDYATYDYEHMRNVQLFRKGGMSQVEFRRVQEQIKLMEKALESAKPYDKIIYRGLRFADKSEFDKFLADDVLMWRSFTSASGTEAIGKQFVYKGPKGVPGKPSPYGILLEIRKSKTAVRIRKLGNYPIEDEILMRRGARYKVIEKKKMAPGQTTKHTVRIILEEM